jgi:hypothetical protein
VDPALIGVAAPVAMFIGSAVVYYCGTEHVDRADKPLVLLGEAEGEPWGKPYTFRTYRFPGDRVQRSQRDAAYDTRQLHRITDTEGYEDAQTSG